MRKVVIDENSGFCFGVINAIRTAEAYLQEHHFLYCLGDIVHNNEEVKRLKELGLIIITKEEFSTLTDTTVLIRAHGEPPETYRIARKNHITLIDATCPVVLNLQKRIKNSYDDPTFKERQILIFGKQGHAEVVGLLGQTGENGIVLSSIEDVEKIDFSKPAVLYSQTTQSLEKYTELFKSITKLYQEANNETLFEYHDTICRKVSNRSHQIREFAQQYDKIIFVSGEKSSNGLYLFEQCKEANPNSFFIFKMEQLPDIPFTEDESIGICGATSTPMWFMEEVKKKLEK